MRYLLRIDKSKKKEAAEGVGWKKKIEPEDAHARTLTHAKKKMAHEINHIDLFWTICLRLYSTPCRSILKAPGEKWCRR